MSVEIKVPSFGESIKEGVIIRWLKKSGDRVRADEDLLEIETEKATSAVPAPAAGVLNITVPEGRKVLIGAVIGQIDESAAAPASAPAPAAKPAETTNAKAISNRAPAAPKESPQPTKATAAPAMSPAARVLVAEKNIDPAAITPSGRGGVIVKEDVLKLEQPIEIATNGKPATESEADRPRINRQKMSPIRMRIAERLLASQQHTATLTTFNEVDMSAVMEMRSRYKEKFEKKHGVNLGFMSFFVKAAVEALRTYPVVNARIDGDEIVYQNFQNIGVAVASEKGLFVPVVKNCGQLSFAEIEKTIADLALRARDGKIRPDDLADGTFTVTNGGIFGSMMSTPILNPPQSAILGMHAIIKRPIAVNDQIVIRPMMYLALSYDHRLVDGRDAVLFLVRIKECLEGPERLLLEV
jgi:2-oxoglutarate dehydrogenase E2 component (dihydrolipoamide succinyltransferase)